MHIHIQNRTASLNIMCKTTWIDWPTCDWPIYCGSLSVTRDTINNNTKSDRNGNSLPDESSPFCVYIKHYFVVVLVKVFFYECSE